MSIRFEKIGDLAERIVGEPDGRPLDASDHQEAFESLQEIEGKLDALMQASAQAMYDDESGSGERADALRDVANIVGMTGPHPRLDVLYEASEVTPR